MSIALALLATVVFGLSGLPAHAQDWTQFKSIQAGSEAKDADKNFQLLKEADGPRASSDHDQGVDGHINRPPTD
jgi:hypothetical protein